MKSATAIVSVVVPCFNQSSLIGETLASVRNQTFPDWECLVVDDGSTDDTAATVEAYTRSDSRFRYLRKDNGGVASARNIGIKHAVGRYILPLDGDDKILRTYLAKAVEHLDENPQTRLVYCKARLFGEKRKLWRLPKYSYDKLLWQNMIFNSAVYRKDAFERTSGYREQMTHGFEDWEFYIRLLDRDCVVHMIDQPLFLYRVLKKSRSSDQIESGAHEESMRQIYLNNLGAYQHALDNPLLTFAKRLKDLGPEYARRYKRQLTYVHAAYITVIMIFLAVHFL